MVKIAKSFFIIGKNEMEKAHNIPTDFQRVSVS